MEKLSGEPISKYQEYVNVLILKNDFTIAETDTKRPWGGFIRLNNKDAKKFVGMYFSDISEQFENFDNLSPKYLIVAPGQQLSWQYHHRRAEHWRGLKGEVGVRLSDTDELPETTVLLNEGELVQFPAEKRHRLIGLDDWGIVVEIWEHVSDKPSDEEDIVRVEDNYGR